jgi:hypothetical protein
MRLKTITPIPPKSARCIEVDAPNRLFAAGGIDGKSVLSHNSVVQRNIIIGAILRPLSWRFLGIDLKKVELSGFRAYSNVVLGIATTIEDALTVLRFAQETMMKRYAELEQLGLNNFLDLPEQGQALLVMVDEAGELLSPSGVKALSENTPIVTPDGLILLKDLQVGNVVLNSNSEAVKIINKYIPIDQTRFSLKISRDYDGSAEKFIAGSEHYWVAYFEMPDGRIEGPKTVDTRFLYTFKSEQDSKPKSERCKIKFRKFQ